MSIGLVAGALVALTAAAAALAGDGGRAKIRYTAADQASARATVLQSADLSPAAGWSGGPTAPNLVPLTCAGFHPKQSDLVVTGAAASRFSNVQTGVTLSSQVSVLRTTRMVRLDWRRSTARTPALTSCLRTSVGNAVGSHGKLVSFRWLAVSDVAACAIGFQAVVKVSVAGRSARVLFEQISACRGRTEIGLTLSTLAANSRSATAEADRLARLLVARAHA